MFIKRRNTPATESLAVKRNLTEDVIDVAKGALASGIAIYGVNKLTDRASNATSKFARKLVKW